ncbi:MAG: hypothetical protein WC547_09780 [Candidatus Omnitrophota bacterium]
MKVTRRTANVVLVILAGVFALGVAVSVFAAKHIPSGFSGGDGRSREHAVIIRYAGDYELSVEREYDYISSIFGARDKDWAFIGQRITQSNGKFYDEVTIKMTFSREIFTIYFDITEPYTALQRHLTNND